MALLGGSTGPRRGSCATRGQSRAALAHLIQEGVALGQRIEGQEEEKGRPLLQLVVQQKALSPVGSQPAEEALPVLQGPLPNIFSSEVQGFVGIELKGEESPFSGAASQSQNEQLDRPPSAGASLPTSCTPGLCVKPLQGPQRSGSREETFLSPVQGTGSIPSIAQRSRAHRQAGSPKEFHLTQEVQGRPSSVAGNC